MSLAHMTKQAVHIVEYWIDGVTRKAILVPCDAHGSIMQETFDGSGIMQGQTVSGGSFQVPLENITNVFASWWQVGTQNNQGHHTWNLDDEAMDDYVQSRADNPDNWTKDGTLKDDKGREITGSDDEPKHGRKIRG